MSHIRPTFVADVHGLKCINGFDYLHKTTKDQYKFQHHHFSKIINAMITRTQIVLCIIQSVMSYKGFTNKDISIFKTGQILCGARTKI